MSTHVRSSFYQIGGFKLSWVQFRASVIYAAVGTDLYEFFVFPFLLAPLILKKQVDFSSYCIVDVYTAHDPPQNWAGK